MLGNRSGGPAHQYRPAGGGPATQPDPLPFRPDPREPRSREK